MNILGLIPARGGSKGVPRKNIKLMAGKPLIAYSVESAINSKYINQIVVSTEDPEIGKTAIDYGAEFIKRPKKFAQDESPTIDAVSHVIEYLDQKPDLIVLLQPTSPLRNSEDIDSAIDLFMGNVCQAVVSVCELDHPKIFKIEHNFLKTILKEEQLNMRRQDLPKLYATNGAVYVIEPEVLKEYGTFIPPKTIPYFMPNERSIDIDNNFDFFLSELIINNVQK